MLHVDVAALPTQGQYQRVSGMEKKMNNIGIILSNEIQMLQFLMISA